MHLPRGGLILRRMSSDFEFGSSPVRRRREPDQVPKVVFCVGVALIVVIGGLLWAVVGEQKSITGPGADVLAESCRTYLHFGATARPLFIDRLESVARFYRGKPAGIEAEKLSRYMDDHPEDPSFARVRAILGRCK